MQSLSTRLFSPVRSITKSTATTNNSEKIVIVAISDTHNLHHDIRDPFPRKQGDIFIHAGDLTVKGTEQELRDCLQWIYENTKGFTHKFYIGGNHDRDLQRQDVLSRLEKEFPDLKYLHKRTAEVTIKGRKLKIYGNSQSPFHSNGNRAFTYQRETSKNVWSGIPRNVDILITHAPPYDICDEHEKKLGCKKLLQACWKAKPKLHICGHIHTGRLAELIKWKGKKGEMEKIDNYYYTDKRPGSSHSPQSSSPEIAKQKSETRKLLSLFRPVDKVSGVRLHRSPSMSLVSETRTLSEGVLGQLKAVIVPSNRPGYTTAVNACSKNRKKDGMSRGATLILM